MSKTMSSAPAYQLSAIALLIGGGLAIVGTIGQGLNDQPLASLWMPASLVGDFGLLLLILGLPAVYALQLKQAGKLGLLGFILFFFAMLLFGGSSGVTDLILLPLAAKSDALTNPSTAFLLYFLLAKFLLLIGSLVFGIATLRAGVFSKGPAILLLIGSIFFLLLGRVELISYIGEVLFLFSLMWFGFTLPSLARQDSLLEPARTATDVPARA